MAATAVLPYVASSASPFLKHYAATAAKSAASSLGSYAVNQALTNKALHRAGKKIVKSAAKKVFGRKLGRKIYKHGKAIGKDALAAERGEPVAPSFLKKQERRSLKKQRALNKAANESKINPMRANNNKRKNGPVVEELMSHRHYPQRGFSL